MKSNESLADHGSDIAPAAQALADGDVERAALGLHNALEADPSNWRARFLLGRAKAAGGASDPAVEAFARVTRDAPEFAPGWIAYATTSLAAGRAAEAAAHIGRHGKDLAKDPAMRLAYAKCLEAAGDPTAALSVLTPLADTSADARFLLGYAELANRVGATDVAERALDAVDALGHESARSCILWGTLRERVYSDDAGALSWYRRALELEPDDVTAQMALASFLMKASKFRDLRRATELFEAVCREDRPPPTVALINLAVLRRVQQRAREAKALADEVLARAPRRHVAAAAEAISKGAPIPGCRIDLLEARRSMSRRRFSV